MSVVFCLMTLLSTGSADVYEDAVRVRRHLHQFPELSNREYKTQAYLISELKALGLEHVEEMAGTGIRVVIDHGNPGRTLAFRADIDALPVDEKTGLSFGSVNQSVMHACGHDVHTAILFATIKALANQPDAKGRFVFLFQPAEEGPPPGEKGGASLMIEDGALTDPKPDVVFGLHLMPDLKLGTIATRPAGMMARADRFLIEITGKQAHGARPQLGVDALYVAAQVVASAQSLISREVQPGIPAVVTFGEFHAGSRFNIVSGSASLTGTIRTLDRELGHQLPNRLERVVKGVCDAHRATYTFEYATLAPVTFNDEAWVSRVQTGIRSSGLLVEEASATMIAEDFGFYSDVVPAVYFFLGTCSKEEACANIHTSEFNPPEAVIKHGVDLWLAIAASLGPVNP